MPRKQGPACLREGERQRASTLSGMPKLAGLHARIMERLSGRTRIPTHATPVYMCRRCCLPSRRPSACMCMSAGAFCTIMRENYPLYADRSLGSKVKPVSVARIPSRGCTRVRVSVCVRAYESPAHSAKRTKRKREREREID